MTIKSILIPGLWLIATATWADPGRTDDGFGDFTPELLSATSKLVLPAGVNDSREPVHFSWPLDSAAPLERPELPVNQSQSYWLDVNAEALANGVGLPLTAPGAVVRISPKGHKALKIGTDQLHIRADGQWYPGSQAVSHWVDGEALKKAGLTVSDNTLAFRLKPELGSGDVRLRINTGAKANAGYLIHVFEPDSPVVLRIRSRQLHYALGDRIELDLTLEGLTVGLNPDDLTGVLVSPDGGQTQALKILRRADGGLSAVADTQGLKPELGLFEAHLLMEKQASGTVLRDITLPLAVAPITATLAGQPTADWKPAGPEFQFVVDVAHPGRYEISGVLYAEGAPLAVLSSADWLDRGAASLKLRANAELLDGIDPTTPLQIRQLVLKDQSRLGVLRREHLGVEIAPALRADPRQ